MLSCPQCGGNVAADATKCPFCTCLLLVRACPKCLARVFHGHKHCPHCGVVTESGAASAASTLVCPRCDVGLGIREVGDVALHECERCVGVYIDAVAIERMLGDRQQARAEAVVGTYRGVARRSEAARGKLYIKCPTCRTIMNRRQFARGAGIIVDVCQGHGTWFDAGELPAVVEFVMNGGLERAEKKAIAEALEAARQAKAAAQAARLSSSYVIPGTGGSGHADDGTALLDLLVSLWR
jgi:Zn-finger nucleic acid-binding protein